MPAVLETKNLTFTYGGNGPFRKTAVSDVNISIEKGEFIGVIGHTGSGKSTLIQQLNGLLRPTSGTVLLNGKDIWADPKKIRQVRFQVGMVFQYPEHQLFEATVLEDVCFGPKNQGLSKEEQQERAREALKSVGLDESCYGKSPFELSGGQKRRAAIAGVIAMKPSVLILDEPTAGLDPRGRDEILDLVADMHRNYGCTVILVSHSMEDVANYVERIIVMNDGQVLYDDVPRQVFRHYQKLEEIGLAAPQVTYLMHELKEEGFPVDCDATTIEEAKAEILKLC